MTNDNTQELNAAKRYIDSIDFSMIIDKMTKHESWLKKDAEKTCQYYRNFLFLKKKYASQPIKIPPSQDVDEFWHRHILDTEKYIHDCQAIFGHYLHHYPYFGIDAYSTWDDLTSAFDQVQKIHLAEFGYPIEATKSSRARILNFFLSKVEILK